MGQIVVLTMSGTHEKLDALGDRHEVIVVEPRWPECQQRLEALTPGLVIVDGEHAPSHGRTVARWMASLGRFRTVPFLFLEVADRDMSRVKRDVPRASFGTWSSVVGTSGRLVKE